MIYRKEEWFKVLYTKRFTFGFDANETFNDKMSTYIEKSSVNTDIKFDETYCEIWARVINCIFFVNQEVINKKISDVEKNEKLIKH